MCPVEPFAVSLQVDLDLDVSSLPEAVAVLEMSHTHLFSIREKGIDAPRTEAEVGGKEELRREQRSLN